ncbi:hypothetical protein ID875_06925 [Streptomyces globisporus]|uniref:Uncharacterized protein n=1 Tax=Streptomyces globisporus TaxID=1908 RepID=A0A927BK81_STRGL|nr:hypothetical protein [Streptomyces globisporus]
MELIQTIFEAIYSLLAESIPVWPVALLVVGLVLWMQSNKDYRKYIKSTLLTALALAGIMLLILAAGETYGADAMPYQMWGVGLYYLALLAWLIPTIRGIGASRK